MSLRRTAELLFLRDIADCAVIFYLLILYLRMERNDAMKTLLLDMYGVILEESKGNFIPYTYAHFPQSAYDHITHIFRVEKLFTQAGYGKLSSEEFLSRLGYDDPQGSMKDYIEHHLTLDPGFRPFAEQFYQKYNFVLLSTDVSEWSRYITEYHRLDGYFKQKIVSGDVGLRKPDPAIYAYTLKTLGVSGEDCLFVDNSVENLRAAEAFGITPILFNRDGEDYDGRIVNSFDELARLL